jgi:YD repeat-containing protein
MKNAGPPRDENCSNPVNGATGNKYQVEVDYPPVADHPLFFARHYNASSHRARALGRGWLHTYDRLFSFTGTAQGSTALLVRPEGQAFRFTREATGWQPDADVNHRLTDAVVNGQVQWQLTVAEDNSTEIYDASARLTSIIRADSRRVSLSYDANGRLRHVSDAQSGQRLTFAYATADSPQIASLIDPAGNVFTYQYAGTPGNQLLSSVTYPGAAVSTRQYMYNESAHTGGADLPDALTGIIDENGQRYASYGYDASGRGTYTEHAGGVDRYALAYNNDGSTTVTDPLGSARTYSYATVHDVRRQVGQDQPAGSGCLASTSARTYDASGNIASSTDFSGRVTAHTWDLARNLLTQTVEASGTPQARTLGFTWHPDWRLLTRQDEPGRRISLIHHGQPDPFNGNALANCTVAGNLPYGKPLPVVCKRVEQALDGAGAVDAGVAAQVTSLSYDDTGRVLGVTNPRGQLTSYAYHATTAYDAPVAGTYDPDFEHVTLLLKGNGTSGSTVVQDQSLNGTAVGVFGDAQVSSAQSVFGGTAIVFDGVSDYLTIPYTAQNSLASGDFTVEMFLYKVANNPNAVRLWSPNGDLYDGLNLGIDANGNFAVYLSTTGITWNFNLPIVANLSNGQWYHLAVSRAGGSVFAFVNGVRYTVTTTLGASTPLYAHPSTTRVIGGQGVGVNRGLNGYIDEFRITRGKARYTESFTPPMVEFLANGPQYSPNDVGHSKGDLASVTNPAGHVTQYTQYDRAGRVRQMIDAKGVVSDISYTPRGWVSSVVSTPPGGVARTTTYSYDNAGQLTGVSHPDGTTLSYSYDAAQRLVGVSDERGNTVSYTLDNMGNRVSEEIKDPGGVLQRSISRSFDALNRLQQITGAAQ